MNNNSQLIDSYLQHEMSAGERAAFEQQLATDKELLQEFAIQQQIIKAAETAGLKNEFAKAIKKRLFNKRLLQAGIVIAILATAFTFYAIKNNLFTRHHTKENIKAAEQFVINNAADTIIETKDGVVFAIPAHAFNASSNNIQLEVRTALSAYDIMQNGLSTMSNDAMLQTAGMFYINGYENGQPVSLAKDINVSVPAREINPGMQLFDAVEDTDGHINWVNPTPVEKRLRTYDITSLDFYPPDYITTVKALQKDYQNKKYTDSLYYSFSGYPHSIISEMPAKDPVAVKIDEEVKNDTGRYVRDTTGKILHDNIDERYAAPYEIDPARIKSIWNKKFNHTIIATKEFEERLRFMHSLCTAEYLDVYLRNLAKPLHESDQFCADQSGGEVKTKFLEFAARKDGAVIIADGMQEKLSNYFQRKYMAYRKASEQTWAKYEAELTRLNSIADAKTREEEIKNLTRKSENFLEEFCINLTDAYRQIGINRSCNDTIIPPTTNYYNITITTTGWKNLDMFVFDATTNRQSMTYTDPFSRKISKLTYSEINMIIENQTQYDKVLVYLIPDSLSSFQLVSKNENSFIESLNSLFHYDVLVLAYKGTQAFFCRQPDVQPKEYVFTLSPLSDEVLRKMLKNYSHNKKRELRSEFEYQLFTQSETFRQIQLQKNLEFRVQVAASIFSCSSVK